ncbi:MAG: GNAT family N-acetyltransferase [Legionellales bacterium]
MNPILMDLPMPITTARLLIRPPLIGDGVVVNAAILESYDVLHEFVDWAKTKPSVDETEEHIRLAAANWILKKNEEPYLELYLFDKISGEFVGGTGFHHINWAIPSVETGYWIRSSRSGQGLMTEAINAITQYAFRQMGVKRIAITCDIDNTRSKKIAERLHYTLEGILKFHRRKSISGALSDTMVYAQYAIENLPPLLSVVQNQS